MTKKLTNMPYAQAKVVIDENNAITLISYTTTVVVIDPQGWLTCSGTYSQTTRKHISAFMKEYGNGADYYTAKRCYEDGVTYNIYTGEIVSLADGE